MISRTFQYINESAISRKWSDLYIFRDFRDLADICCTLADVQQRLGNWQRFQRLVMTDVSGSAFKIAEPDPTLINGSKSYLDHLIELQIQTISLFDV